MHEPGVMGFCVDSLRLTDDPVYLIISDKEYEVAVTAERHSGRLLKAPLRTEKHKRVNETMKSRVELRVRHRSGKTIFEGEGRNVALEVHGDLDRLLNTR